MQPSLRNRLIATAAALALAAGATVMFAAPASADRVWYQSIGRSSATAACPATTEAEKAAGWAPWEPSWEKWPNNNNGGFVCSRSIVWALEGTPALSTCLLVGVSPDLYLDFANGPVPPTAYPFLDSTCTTSSAPRFQANAWIMMAASIEEAQLVCDVVDPRSTAVRWVDFTPGVDPRVYLCLTR